MKICLIIPSYFPAIEYGGPIYAVRSFAKSLSKTCDVIVHTTTVRKDQNLILPGHELREDGVFVRYYNHLFFIKNSIEMYKNIKSSDLVCINSVFSFFCIFSAFLACFCGKKIVLQPRGSLSEFGLSRRKGLKVFILRIYRIFMRKDDVVLVTSSAEADEAHPIFKSKCRICILPNGFEEPVYSKFYQQLSHKQGVSNIAFVGRFHHKKRIDLLIRALSILTSDYRNADFRLTLFGFEEGNIGEIKELVGTFGLSSKVNFVFNLPREQIIQELSFFDCLALVSENENFGNVILESLYAGTPVVFSDSLPWNDLIKVNLGVSTVPNPVDIAEAIYDACFLKVQAKKFGRSYVLLNFAWEKISAKFVEIVK